MKASNFFREDTGPYPTRARAWDRYKAFHIINGVFVEFETGELMVHMTPQPDSRKYYPEYNLQVVTTSDADCPPLYLDKECTNPVKKAWVTHNGQQHLVIDYERNVAIPLDTGWSKANSVSLGDHVRTAQAYWAGQERMPIALEKISVQTPDPEYKKQMGTVLSEVRAAVAALQRMGDTDDNLHYWEDRYVAKREWLDSSAGDIIAEVCGDPQMVFNIATKGFEYPRKNNEVEFLYVKGR